MVLILCRKQVLTSPFPTVPAPLARRLKKFPSRKAKTVGVSADRQQAGTRVVEAMKE
jgi:hypothetical protein